MNTHSDFNHSLKPMHVALCTSMLLAVSTFASANEPRDTQHSAKATSPSQVSSPTNMGWQKTQLLTLAKAQQLVAQASKNQSLWQQREKALQTSRWQAGRLENPTLDIQLDGLGGDNEQSIGLTQSIDWYGKRKLRQSIVSQKQVAEPLKLADYEAKRDVLVMARFAEALLADEALSLAKARTRLQERALDVANKRLRAGRISQLERDRLALAAKQARLSLQTYQTQASLTKNKLAELWGDASFNFKGLAQQSYPTLAGKDVLLADFENSVSMQLNEYALQLNEAKQSLARKMGRADPALSFGMNQADSQDSGSTSTAFVGLSIPLPVFQANQGNQTALTLQRDVLLQESALRKRQTAFHLTRLAQSFSLNKQQYALVKNNQLPLTERLYAKTLTGYEHGKFSLSDVLDAQTQTLDLQQEGLGKLTELWQNALQIKGLIAGFSLDTDLNDPVLWDSLQFGQFDDARSLINDALQQ